MNLPETSSKRRLSKSGKTPRFVPDTRLGTDRGRSVHVMRVKDGWFPAAHHGRGNQLFCVSNGRQMETFYYLYLTSTPRTTRSDNSRWKVRSFTCARNHAPAMTARCSLSMLPSPPASPALPSLCTLSLLIRCAGCVHCGRRRRLVSKSLFDFRDRLRWQSTYWA